MADTREPRDPAAGPLVVSPKNPRFFIAKSDPHERAVYLAGSHIWHNFHDGLGPGEACGQGPESMDFDEYLTFLEERGHNFIRLWRWEQFRSYTAMADYHLCMEPQPWMRSGPGEATDGKPWGLHLSTAPMHVEGHPFHAKNNVNGVAIDSIVDLQVLPLDPQIQRRQEAYIRAVIDAVHDLPNVLWEVSNESAGGGKVDADILIFKSAPTRAAFPRPTCCWRSRSLYRASPTTPGASQRSTLCSGCPITG